MRYSQLSRNHSFVQLSTPSSNKNAGICMLTCFPHVPVLLVEQRRPRARQGAPLRDTSPEALLHAIRQGSSPAMRGAVHFAAFPPLY